MHKYKSNSEIPNSKLLPVQDSLLTMAMHYARKRTQRFLCEVCISTVLQGNALVPSSLCRHNQSLLGTGAPIVSPHALQSSECDANSGPSSDLIGLSSLGSQLTSLALFLICDRSGLRVSIAACLFVSNARPNFMKFWAQLPTIIIKGSTTCRITPESTVCHLVLWKIVWDIRVSCFN